MSAIDPDQPQNSLRKRFIALLGQLRLASLEPGWGWWRGRLSSSLWAISLDLQFSATGHLPCAWRESLASLMRHKLPATAGQHDGCLPEANGSKRRGGYNLRLPVHPRPLPKTSLRLIQHPAPLFFTFFFSPSEMDGGSDGVSFVRKARGKLWMPIIICSFPGASPQSVPPCPPQGRTGAKGVGGGRRLGEEPGEVKGITSLMFWLGWATELPPQMGEISLSVPNSGDRGKTGGWGSPFGCLPHLYVVAN